MGIVGWIRVPLIVSRSCCKQVSGKWNCVLARTESHVQNSNEGGIHEGTLKVHNLAKVASTVTDNTTPAHNNVDQQDLILIACMASKRGDIAALEVRCGVW